jgi:hypothetical protein
MKTEVKLSEETTIPFWWMLVAIPTFIGGVTWISFIAYTSTASAEKIEKLEQRIEKKEDILLQIREDVAIIKSRLENKK